MNYGTPPPRKDLDRDLDRRRLHMVMAITLCASALLAACATPPTVKQVIVSPMAPAGEAITFAMVPVDNDANREASAIVANKLESLGYGKSGSPTYLVEASAMNHPAATGAFIPATEGGESHKWIDRPDRKYGKTRKMALILRVRFLDPKTGGPVLLTTSRLVSSKISLADSARKMVDAMFATDPLRISGVVPPTAVSD